MVIFRDYSGLTILINLTYYESNTGIMLALKPMFFSQLLEMMDGNAKHDAASLLLNIITDWKADDHIIKQAFSKLQSDLNLCCQLIVCATNHTSLKDIEDDFVKYILDQLNQVKIDSEEWKLAFDALQHLPTKDWPNF